MRPTLELAENHHGPVIRALLYQGDEHAAGGLDWSDIGHNWLIAKIDERVVGCLQVLPGRPMGRIEHLGLSRAMTDTQRARVTKLLLDRGYALLKATGSQAAMGFVPNDLKSYKKVLKKRGGVVVSTGNFMLKRLR